MITLALWLFEAIYTVGRCSLFDTDISAIFNVALVEAKRTDIVACVFFTVAAQ